VDVYWPAVALLFYVLCGMGFTIQGIYALFAWRERKRQAREDAAGSAS
jgi:hypothetical protein